MEIITNYMTKHGLYNVKDITPKGAFLHSVGCPVDKAESWWNRWNKPSYADASVHGFIDDEKAIIALPCMEKKGVARKSFHVARDYTHERYLSFEMCEYGGIRYTGGANWDHSNEAEVVAYAKKTYANAVELFAVLCKFHGWNPLEDGVILSHYEGYQRGIASGHSDPEHIWKYAGLTMDGFRKDVAKRMNGEPIVPSTSTSTSSAQIYRIRKTWADSKSQKGAFRNLNNAKAECDKYDGYSVFDENGTAVYTSKVTSTATKPSTTSKTVVPNITYAVQTKRHGILPDVKNREDYAGLNNSEIVAIKIGVDVGSVKYRVHTVAGQWLPYVTGCNWDDYNNGYAGDEVHAIDAIEVYYTTDTSKTGGKYYRACYQVKGKGNSNYWANQYDNEKGNGQDGYAGAFDVPLVELKMSLE